MLPPQHLQLSLSQTIDPYLIDQLSHLSNQETDTLYQCTDYFQRLHLSSSSTNDKSTPNISSSMVTSADRRTMCNWSYDIVDACQIDREVAVIGMNYFDRYMSLSTTAADTASSSSTLSSTAPTTRKSFQLTYITCLIIALKCRGGLQVDSDFVSTTICQGK